jgi:hypothetical protein
MMYRFVCLLLLGPVLFTACATQNKSASKSSPNLFQAYRKGLYTMSNNFQVATNTGGKFSLGDTKEAWDSADRYEIDWLFHFPLNGNTEPLLGAYIFYENRDYSDGRADIDYDAIGGGVESAMIIHFLEDPKDADFKLGLMPYGRFGGAFQDGTFKDVPESSNFASGDMDELRGEFTLGLDLRTEINNKYLAAVGVGFSYWFSSHPDAEIKDRTGVVVDDSDRLRFSGTDLFIRASVGFKF